MKIVIFDPKPVRHDYLSPCYFQPMREYASRHGIPLSDSLVLSGIKNSTVCCLADYLEPDAVSVLKNNGNKVVGFSVTDSSYVSQCCREAGHLKNIDLMFMITGLQTVNHGHEMIVNDDFEIELEPRQFLPDDDWAVFDSMRKSGRLQSLPYVHAERQPSVPAQPYNSRSQKALIRGGHHMRRFILALKLLEIDRLDINSGFVTSPYFQDNMNPQFRYCDECRTIWKKHGIYPLVVARSEKRGCPNEAMLSDRCDLSNLGYWNNRCPESFYRVGAALFLNSGAIIHDAPYKLQAMLNARWLTQQQHLEMLARITFTSDLKWLFSIYAAQRFWDAAMVGCINLLPSRTVDQQFFPEMHPDIHYLTFNENLKSLDTEFEIDEASYNEISGNAKALYDEWMRPTHHAISDNLLKHIFFEIERRTA